MQSRLQYASLFQPKGTRTLPKLSWNLPVKDSLAIYSSPSWRTCSVPHTQRWKSLPLEAGLSSIP